MPGHDDMLTRRTLLQKIGDSGNTHAWYEFVYYYRGYIYGIARKCGASHHDAEEATQQVLLKLTEIVKDFEYSPEKGRFRNYLARITANTVRNIFRGRRQDVSMSEMPEGFSESLSEDSSIDKMAEEEWLSHLWSMAWRNVSGLFEEKVRKTWEMLAAGNSPQDIAVALQLAENSIYVYKKRVLEKLKPELKRLERDLE